MSFRYKKNPERIFILGTGSTWDLAPKKTDAIIYALNDYIRIENYGIQPDLLFIMDVLDEKPQIVSGKDSLPEVVEKINKLNVPLIAPFRYAEIPKSVAFPLKKATEELGMAYYTNTICYMIAYAIMAGAKEIELFGVNQSSADEYGREKAGVEYWLGVAHGRGIKVSINGEKSELLKARDRWGGEYMYGYNQTYEQVMEAERKFGEPIIKQLSEPPRRFKRQIKEPRRL